MRVFFLSLILFHRSPSFSLAPCEHTRTHIHTNWTHTHTKWNILYNKIFIFIPIRYNLLSFISSAEQRSAPKKAKLFCALPCKTSRKKNGNLYISHNSPLTWNKQKKKMFFAQKTRAGNGNRSKLGRSRKANGYGWCGVWRLCNILTTFLIAFFQITKI